VPVSGLIAQLSFLNGRDWRQCRRALGKFPRSMDVEAEVRRGRALLHRSPIAWRGADD
jgi:hypothetical protein